MSSLILINGQKYKHRILDTLLILIRGVHSSVTVTCVSQRCAVTVSRIAFTSVHMTPPTTIISNRGWLLGRGRAELMNRLEGGREGERNIHSSGIRGQEVKRCKRHCWGTSHLKPDLRISVKPCE